MSEERFTLGSLVGTGALELSDGYRTKQVELGHPGVPILRVAEVSDGRISPTYKDFVREDFRRAFGHKASQPGDVVLTTKGTVGRVARIGPADREFVYSPQLCFFRVVDNERLDPHWLYYWFRGPEFRVQAGIVQNQTDMAPYINLVDVRRMVVTLPGIKHQRAIAEVLGALDDKIEVNRRIARRCTKLAICQGIDLLSRGEGQWVSLEQVADVSKGVSYRSDDLVSGGGWLVSLKCVGRDGSFQPKGLKPFSGPAKDAQVVEEGDILVAQTDVTQRAEVIGRPLRVERLGFDGRFVASLDFVIVRPHQELTRELLLVLLSQREFRDHALGYCNGTTVLHMNSRAVPGYQFRLPDADTATRASVVAQPLLACADVARREARILAALRDVLLPKLLSRKLRVRDAESLVEEAV